MAYEKVKRNRYYDPPSEFPHSSRNHAEDQQEFHIPMHRMHNSNLHDWGIARGLEVSGTIGGTEIVVNPGVAIDGNGQLISLSSVGHGYVGSEHPDVSYNVNDEKTTPVHLGTGSHVGQTVYVTIQFAEIMRPSEGSGGRMEQVPWLRLQPVSGTGAYVDDGTSIILAIAEINASGNLAALKAEDGILPYRRRLIGETIEELRIQRSEKVGNSVEETPSGKIGPGTGGGLQITVPNSGDGISFIKEGGGNFSNLEVRANNVVAKDSAGREALKLDANGAAALTIGTNGNEGNLIVKDGSGREVMKFDGNSAALYLGVNGNEGDIYIRNNSGDDTFKVDGNEGDIFVWRKIGGVRREVMKFDASHAALYIGSQGNEGDIFVRDGAGREVMHFDSNYAALYLGAAGNEGDLIVKDNSGNESAKIDGNTGTMKMRKIDPYGNALDIDARYVHIHGWDLMLDGRSGGNKRALVDYTNKLIINYANDYANGVDVDSRLRTKVDGIYRTLGGNPTRYVTYRFLYADDGTTTQEVNLGSSRRFTAFTSIIGMDPRHDFDRGDAFAVDVYTIDGNRTGTWICDGRHFGASGSTSNIHSPAYTGYGQRIIFRARSFQDASVFAIGVVFYE